MCRAEININLLIIAKFREGYLLDDVQRISTAVCVHCAIVYIFSA